MLTTFTTEHGLLVIRSEDLRRLEDTPEGCTLCFVEDGQRTYMPILGMAQDNLNRILAQERQAIVEYEAMQRRQQAGQPTLPIVRGGKVAQR